VRDLRDFLLDTSGAVTIPHSIDGFGPENPLWGAYTWERLSHFAQGYVEAMLRAAMLAREECDGCPGENPEDPDGPRCCRLEPAFSDLAPETLSTILRDCDAFDRATAGYPPHGPMTKEQGAEFWAGRRARRWWSTYPPLTVALNDVGKVVFA
jgi:hypothetical protein